MLNHTHSSISECTLITMNTPKLKQLTSLDLSCKVDIFVGFSSGNEAVFGNTDDKTFNKMSLVNGKYTNTLCKKEVKVRSHEWMKCFLEDGHLLIRDYKGADPTMVYNSTMTDSKSYSGDYGRLLSVIEDGRALYRKSEQAAQVDMYQVNHEHQLVCSLHPPHGCQWSGWLSICSIDGGQIVVTDGGISGNQTLNFYDSKVEEKSCLILLM